MKKILLSFFIGVMLIACNQKTVSVREVWTKEQANEWYKQWGWLRGCDFNSEHGNQPNGDVAGRYF